MPEELIDFLLKFKELSVDEAMELGNLLSTKTVAKGSIVVHQEEFCNLCFFVLKGCMRQYVIEDGVDKTIGIYTEEQAINYFNQEETNAVSASYLSAIEDSILLVGNPEKDEVLYKKFPALVTITRKMIEGDLAKSRQNLASFITSSPEQRYLQLIENRPDIVLRVPQVIIASFLGITPESLSRIRRRIQKTAH
jgi:CRP-like cAMP-binding protein